MASLCDTCHSPGHCCKEFHLDNLTTWKDEGISAVAAALKNAELPFTPVRQAGTWKDTDGREYVSWYATCQKLTSEGRCSIYETRPALCRKYEPASDALCVYYVPKEKADGY